MDQRLALGACTPQIAPLGPPPAPKGASGQRLVGGGVVGVQNQGVAPPPPPKSPLEFGAGSLHFDESLASLLLIVRHALMSHEPRDTPPA